MLNIVITAGGTSEPIDNVRKITNSSTGKLGAVIAEELLKREDIDKMQEILANDKIEYNVEKMKGQYNEKKINKKVNCVA